MNNDVTMEQKSKILPELRFPEFVDDGEWKEKSISEIGETINGLSGKSSADFGEGSPYVTYKQVFDNSIVDFSKCAFVKILDNEKQNILKKGDVLFTTSSETPNEVGYASTILSSPTESTYLNSFCFAVRPFDIKEIKPEFSRYLFHSPLYRRKIGLLAQGSTRYNISKSAFIKLNLYFPKPNEQQKIADCLSSLDELIIANNDKLETLKNHKKGLLQNLFPQEGQKVPNYRFPEFVNDGKWEEKKLGDIANISKLAGYEFTKHIIYEDKGKIIALRGLNIKNNKLELSDVKYIDNSGLDKLSRSKLYINDLMFTYIGTIGEVALINENDKYYLAPNVSRIRCDKQIVSAKFLLQYFNIPNFKEREISKYISSSSQPALTMENVRKFLIFLPTMQEQQKIAECVSAMDDMIDAQTEKIKQLKTHKKGLMQGLFPKID
jgi:type I restriction enzyme S subunit